ncbi:hypothetical protein Tco_0285869 [Tanacetum coccineum]
MVADEEETNSDFDDKIKSLGILEESSKPRPIKNFTYINESGEMHQMTIEEIKNQKGIEEQAIAKEVKFERKSGKKFLIKALGQDVVEKVYKDKVKYDKNFLKMLNIRAKVICMWVNGKKFLMFVPRIGAGWKEIYTQRLGDLTKRYKQSVQYNDHRARTVLNEPALGMILFSAQHKKDFISINDFGELNVDMLYTVQEIFHRLHQGPGMEDLARTFSSLLVVEVDKRNLNPNKQMRVIEQLRQ